ncbi:MAG: Rieske 2Fe-2S domain-containing protein [Burkholderiaceae bacterium]|nr:Rieske 2Fe-2S domain-containing protein [Desulfobacterales bacterium]MDP3138582.1 Rieske 2Fe-2S domain-containing protein [Burkholderiaceae bacterium]
MTTQTIQWLPLCPAVDVGDDFGRQVILEGSPPLAVFKLGEDFCVTADTCSHGNASLCEGYVEGEEVECPFHAGKFNIRTGEATAFPCVDPIRTYRSRVNDGIVEVDAASLQDAPTPD